MAGAPEGAAMDDTRQEKYGKFEITPQVVVAGQLVTFELTYHVGEFGIDDGGSLMICVRDVSARLSTFCMCCRNLLRAEIPPTFSAFIY